MEVAVVGDVVKLPPRKEALEYFWLTLEIALEFIRDYNDSNMLRSLMHEEYARLATELAADTDDDAARWAMLLYALEVCRDS